MPANEGRPATGGLLSYGPCRASLRRFRPTELSGLPQADLVTDFLLRLNPVLQVMSIATAALFVQS